MAAQSLGSTVNPWDQVDGTTSAIQYGVYDRLVRYTVTKDENGNDVADINNLEGCLAESWEVSDDQLVWTFHLNPKAKFANGDKVTSEDVIWSYENCRDNPNSSFFFGLTNITEMEAPDEETVVLKLSQRCNIFLRMLEIYDFCIVNKSEAEAAIANDPEYLTTHACGSGPYSLVTFDTTSEIVLEKRDDYWDEANMAKNDKVTWKLVQEASERQMLLEKGDVDIALDVDDKEIEGMAKNADLTVLQFASNRHLFLCMNMNDEYFGNPLVRKAVAYALSYDDLVDEVMYGTAIRTTSMLPDNVAGHIAIEGETYVNQDIDKAKELMAEAGYPDGFSCTMTLGDGFRDWEDDAVVIQADLAKIGIKMDINEIARAEFLTKAADKNLQIFINRFNPFIGDPGYLVNNCFASGASFNYFNYNNAEFDDLYAKGEAAETQEERLSYYETMQKMFFEDMPVVEMYQYGFAFCARNNISGHIYFPDGTLRYVYLEKK